MKMTRLVVALVCSAWLVSGGFAKEPGSDADKWDKKYQRLLEERPEIRKKVESGGATKADVIAWMKDGGDNKQSGKDRYYGWKVAVKDPREFSKTRDRVVYSGPQPGEKLTSFQATQIGGNQAGKTYDPVERAKGKPQLLIFQDQSGVALKGLYLIGPVIDTITQKSDSELVASVVFLGDDPANLDPNEVADLAGARGIYETSQSMDGREGPGPYGLNRNVAMTILVAGADGKVLHNFAFTQPMLFPDPHLVGALAEVVGRDRETILAWLSDDATDATSKKNSDRAATRLVQKRPAREQADDTKRDQGERRRYGRGALEVKDPSAFQTKGGKVIFSGPQPGEKLPSFTTSSQAGESKGNEVNPIAVADGRPQILIFQDENGVGIRGLFGLVDAIDKIDRKTDKDLHVTSVFLSDDTEKIGQFAGRFTDALLERGIDLITVSPDGRDGPGAYGLNRTVSQTIILAKDGKVTRSFVYPQGLLYSDPHVMGGVAELIDEDRETVAKWLNAEAEREDQMQMRRGDDPQQAAKAAFREKLGQFVKAGKLTREEAGELYQTAFPE